MQDRTYADYRALGGVHEPWMLTVAGITTQKELFASQTTRPTDASGSRRLLAVDTIMANDLLDRMSQWRSQTPDRT
ncbi:hypothetical protein PSEUDO8AS_10010 [Pseudomonas sp. 8AS]|nr:hypothetical protein PSEUDO8AS_10010 [Pseudomonas sp. 8AS]